MSNDRPFGPPIASIDELTSYYREPSEVAASKSIDHIDEASARYIANCPLVVLSTGGPDGTQDASPRGGPPGFVRCLDERHVALPDLNGNNRLDSHRNLVTNGHAGLLFLVPDQGETLRINGKAWLTTNEEVLASFTDELRPPKMAIIVRTDELFLHCAKAILRSKLWQPETWPAMADAPDGAEIYATQFAAKGFTTEAMRSGLDATYEADLARD